MKKRATIYDVAKEAEVSITTVSRYLNSPDSVKDETGDRIFKAVEKLDYIRQGNAGSRNGRAVGRVGVLTPFFPAPSFVDRLRGMTPAFTENNYELIIYTIETPEQLDEYLSSVPFTRRIDGLILMSVSLRPDQERKLNASGLEIVMIESDNGNYSRVLADDRSGGALAAELFCSRDYFPCVFMGDINSEISYSCHPSELRFSGFSEELEKRGRRIRDIMKADITVEDSQRVFSAYLEENPAPRGVFAMCDVQAVGIIKAARERGLRIPEDMAVLGFDDIESADWMGLSSISQHLGDSGRIAAGLLLEKMAGKGKAIQKVNLKVELIERSTT